ncbi:MAG TPA: DNA-directed RNA polymerase subunit alpha [Gemmatimonadaceae bacterium]|nr:DNA-directed RNA polymerase subunit alpha [Gemmatimonadaceae bacterium]
MATTIDLSGLVRPQLVEATKREDNPDLAEFRMQPLERGFGHTLGNAMRRMLLSSLPGAAVWAFHIDGVVHEHQTIPGVVEDVHQIIGNMKTLALVLSAGESEGTIARIRKSESGPVTAADIQPSANLQVVDPSHHLFTLQDDRDIAVDLYVNRGRGYVEADQHPLEKGLPVDLVRIDAIYNPVKRANFSVAETRVGQRTDYDRLTLTVETNGTITPEEAVSYAAALTQAHFQFFANFGSHAVGPVEAGTEHAPDGAKLQQLFKMPIDEMELSVRSVNSLKNSDIRTLGDLVRQTEGQMLDVKNFGKKSLQEIADLLEREGLNFGMRYEVSPEGIRVTDWGTPPSRAAAQAPDEEE